MTQGRPRRGRKALREEFQRPTSPPGTSAPAGKRGSLSGACLGPAAPVKVVLPQPAMVGLSSRAQPGDSRCLLQKNAAQGARAPALPTNPPLHRPHPRRNQTARVGVSDGRNSRQNTFACQRYRGGLRLLSPLSRGFPTGKAGWSSGQLKYSGSAKGSRSWL